MALQHPARDGRRRDPRPARRRVRALQRRCHLDGAPFREDALRQRAARARLPARLPSLSGDPCLRRSAVDTLDWALREMRGPEGGFYCRPGRRLGGRRGRFYVWTIAELREPPWARTRTPRSPGSAPPSRATSPTGGWASAPRAGAERAPGARPIEHRPAAPGRAARADPRAAARRARERRARPGSTTSA